MLLSLLLSLSHSRFPHRGHHVQNVLASLPAATDSTTHFYKEAILDHFSGVAGASTRWAQRYYIDRRYWCGDGCPVFLYIGGEGPQGAPSDHLFMATLAKRYGALMVALEHRFYGESYPTADMSVDSLRYLSSHQALADLAKFIAYVNAYTPDALDARSSPPLQLAAPTANSKWVSFGGSYPGALSGWLRLKYPASIAGAVSSSGPYFAEANFEQYAQVVGSALANPAIGGSAACYAAVQDGVTALRKLAVGTKPFGTDPAIPPALRPCNSSDADFAAAAAAAPDGAFERAVERAASLGVDLDLATWEASVFNGFQGTVQYNNEVPVVATVAVVCDVMTNTSLGPSPLERLAYLQEAQYFQQCQPASFAAESVLPLLNETFGGYGCNLSCASGRQWIWQSCNEFGFWQTTTAAGKANPFDALQANNLAAQGPALCKAVFGLDAPPATEETNAFYGARAMLGANVTIVNGGMDPWHALSSVDASDEYYESCIDDDGNTVPPGAPTCASQRVASSSRVITIPTTAHCGDMYAPNRFDAPPYCPGPSCHADSPALVKAHQKISDDVGRYIGRKGGVVLEAAPKGSAAAERKPAVASAVVESWGDGGGSAGSSGGLVQTYFPWLRSWRMR